MVQSPALSNDQPSDIIDAFTAPGERRSMVGQHGNLPAAQGVMLIVFAQKAGERMCLTPQEHSPQVLRQGD